MKRLFKLLLFGGVFTLLLTGCNIARGEITVDETILSSLPDSVRQDALYRMIAHAEDANNTNMLIYKEVLDEVLDDNFILPIVITVIITLSILTAIFMLLRAYSRNLKMGYDNLNRLLEKDAALLPPAEIIELFTANNIAKKRKPYIFDATFVGLGIGVILLGQFVREDALSGFGAILFFYGLMRLLMRLLLDRREKK